MSRCDVAARGRFACSPSGTPGATLANAGRDQTIATIDDLLTKVDSKYTLVHLAARRAREINSYYHSLGEGLGQYTPPLVEQVDSNKPLSIALEEIAQEKIVPQHPGDAQRLAQEMLGADVAREQQDDADVVALDPAEAAATPVEEAEDTEDAED